jgi:hypothetical protein
MAALLWEDVRNPELPRAGSQSPEEAAEWVAAHAEESLLLTGVVDIPVLSDAGALALAAVTATLLGRGGDAVGSMHNYGTDLDTAGARRVLPGLEDILDGLLRDVQPLAAAVLLGPTAPARLVRHSAHAIGYGGGAVREKALRLHVDDALLTVNVCLGTAPFTGSGLLFTGAQRVHAPVAIARMQGKRDLLNRLTTVEVAAQPQPARAFVHLGAHPHRTVPILTGERFNWVLWYHGAAATASTSPAPAHAVGGAGVDAGGGTAAAGSAAGAPTDGPDSVAEA